MHNSLTSRVPPHNSGKGPGPRGSTCSVNRTTTTVWREPEHRHHDVVGAVSHSPPACAVWVPLLAGAAWLADAATTASATPVLVSVTRTGPHAQAGGPADTPMTAAPDAGTVVGTQVVSGGSDGSAQQAPGVSILPGPLTVSPATESVSLTQLRAFGRGLPFYRGQLAPVTVVDARGSLVGWRVSISLEGVTGATAGRLAHALLCASAHPPTVVAGNPGDSRGVPLSCAPAGWVRPGVLRPSPGGRRHLRRHRRPHAPRPGREPPGTGHGVACRLRALRAGFRLLPGTAPSAPALRHSILARGVCGRDSIPETCRFGSYVTFTPSSSYTSALNRVRSGQHSDDVLEALHELADPITNPLEVEGLAGAPVREQSNRSRQHDIDPNTLRTFR